MIVDVAPSEMLISSMMDDPELSSFIFKTELDRAELDSIVVPHKDVGHSSPTAYVQERSVAAAQVFEQNSMISLHELRMKTRDHVRVDLDVAIGCRPIRAGKFFSSYGID